MQRGRSPPGHGRRGARGLQSVRRDGHGQLLPGDPRERGDAQAGPFRLPLGLLPGGRAPRVSANARHGLRLRFPRQQGQGRLREAGHRQAGDREGQALAELFRNDLRHPETHGRLALPEGRELGGTGRDSRPVRLRLQRPGSLRPPKARRRKALARRGPELGFGDALAPEGPGARLLLRALLSRAGRPRLRHPDALAALRRGGPRRKGGGAVAFGEDAQRGARWRDPLHIRGRPRPGRRSRRLWQAAGGEEAHAVRDPVRVGPDEALRPYRNPRGGWVAEGSQAGRVRTQERTPTADAPAGSLHLYGRHLAAAQGVFSFILATAIRRRVSESVCNVGYGTPLLKN